MSVCLKCKERYACDRVLYDCPREDKPNGIEDELTDRDKEMWAVTYKTTGYKVPKELEVYL